MHDTCVNVSDLYVHVHDHTFSPCPPHGFEFFLHGAEPMARCRAPRSVCFCMRDAAPSQHSFSSCVLGWGQGWSRWNRMDLGVVQTEGLRQWRPEQRERSLIPAGGRDGAQHGRTIRGRGRCSHPSGASLCILQRRDHSRGLLRAQLSRDSSSIDHRASRGHSSRGPAPLSPEDTRPARNATSSIPDRA
ncbi:hypothetical protein F511_04426 [Dorcoceras hygrometricum]|uniref:Uncharacterized protein n=1 Tax=Dorcoceras hygrometricum TaxID=472368 RepID=A0A2Z7D597_9LAMI|nr:hypothetical protein F511_04426 [Dorcoceras hygrometricum]